MRLLGFIDELVKLGTATQVLRKYANIEPTMTQEPPTELMGDGDYEPADRIAPDEAVTRMPTTGHLPKAIRAGQLGRVTQPIEAIDREKFNRPYEVK